MKVDVKFEGLDKVRRRLDATIVKKAAAKTLNDMSKASKTEISKTIRGLYTLPAKRIKKDIIIKTKASVYKLLAIISFKRFPTPGMQHYKARRIKSGGVSVVIKKGQRKKVGSWFMPVSSKLTGVYRRIGSGRGNIERKFGPSVGGMFASLGGARRIQKLLKERMSRTFWGHYRWLSSGGRK